jgi:outer membrane protein assembly factor BamB
MHAGASAATWTCGDSVAISEVEVTARALAKAAAVALSYAYLDCAADEGWFQCLYGKTGISVWVEAVARAWAEALAGAYTSTDTCSVEVEVVVDAVAHILADAASSAFGLLCGTGVSSKTFTSSGTVNSRTRMPTITWATRGSSA